MHSVRQDREGVLEARRTRPSEAGRGRAARERPSGVMSPVWGSSAESWRRWRSARSRGAEGGGVSRRNVVGLVTPWAFSVRTS